MSNLAKRVVAAALFVPIALISAKLGGFYLLAFVDLVILFGVWELFCLEREKGKNPNRVLGSLLALAVSWEFSFWRGEHIELVLTVGVLLILAFELCRKNPGSPLANVGATLLGVFYVGWLGSFLILIRGDPLRSDLGNLAILILLLAWGTDTVAYFVGMWRGRHSLFPRISPKKSVEGSVGGFVGALLLAFVGNQTLVRFLSLGDSVALGAIVGVGSQIGDLTESFLKRDAGVKDSSSLIPGHGGILDRFDSIFFALPLAYIYIKISGAI